MKAQEAAEEQEVIKVNEAVLRGEEALAETEVPLRVVGRIDWRSQINDIYNAIICHQSATRKEYQKLKKVMLKELNKNSYDSSSFPLKDVGDHVGVETHLLPKKFSQRQIVRKPWLWSPLTPVSLQNGSRPGRTRRRRKNISMENRMKW